MKVTKMQGCGNDFVILDYDAFLKLNLEMPEAAKKLCDRHFGIGADGLIIPNTNTQDADIGWFFYNSDGEPEMYVAAGFTIGIMMKVQTIMDALGWAAAVLVVLVIVLLIVAWYRSFKKQEEERKAKYRNSHPRH